jgi:FkbM family methyltransferase
MSPDRSASAASEVASLLATGLDEPIVVVDVGCRWGFADTWELGDRCRAIGFEPDEDECERLRMHYHDNPSVVIVAQALGAEPGTATLYVTREPACSSVYEPIDDVVDRHPRLEPQRLAARQRLELVTLDSWCEQHGVDRVDYLKLDTQGSELDVLRGAPRTLERVIAVQTEVEFNRMYEGQPLFGDVDRFLRDHGFVLWQFENLVHHRQRGARSVLRRGAQFFDWDVAQFSRRSGQLFWADALFVRSDVARPRPTIPRNEALRHACLTAALGLDDLTGLVLDLHHRDLEGATQEIVDGARALLPASDHETEWLTGLEGVDTREESQETDVVIEGTLQGAFAVDFGAAIEGAGWREPRQFGSTRGRWTGPGRQAWIDVPFRLLPGSRVEVVAVGVPDRCGAATIGVEVNGRPLALELIEEDGGLVLSGTLPDDYETDRQYTRLSIRTPEPVPRFGTIDPRKVGLGIAGLTLHAPPVEEGKQRGERAHKAPPHQDG